MTSSPPDLLRRWAHSGQTLVVLLLTAPSPARAQDEGRAAAGVAIHYHTYGIGTPILILVTCRTSPGTIRNGARPFHTFA